MGLENTEPTITVRLGDIPFRIAMHYSCRRPNCVRQLAEANPELARERWGGWVVGAQCRIPRAWLRRWRRHLARLLRPKNGQGARLRLAAALPAPPPPPPPPLPMLKLPSPPRPSSEFLRRADWYIQATKGTIKGF